MSAQACGKFILGGEHSVVYRGRALAFPLNNYGLKVEESESWDGLIVNGEKKLDHYFDEIQKLRKILGIKSACRGFNIVTQVPFGAGLGSSAALCAALCRLHFSELSEHELALKAFEGEKFFHGRPSGVDPFVVAMARPLLFGSHDLSWREIKLERFREQKLCFVLKDSGLRHRTAEVIECVAKTKNETPLIWEDLMDALSTNVEAMLKAIENNPERDLGRIMNDTHFRLIQLGVSNDTLDDEVEALKKIGALGAKLTGAGRGGFVLGLFHEEALSQLASTQTEAPRLAPGPAQMPPNYLVWKT